MSSVPVAPSPPLQTGAIPPRPGSGDVSTATAGPSRDFAEVLQESSARPGETGSTARNPEPSKPAAAHPGVQDTAGPRDAEAEQDSPDANDRPEILEAGQTAAPRRHESNPAEPREEIPAVEVPGPDAQHLFSRDPDTDGPNLPEGQGKISRPVPAALLSASIPGLPGGVEAALTRSAAANAPPPVAGPQDPETRPGGTETAVSPLSRPQEGGVPPVLHAPALGPRADGTPPKSQDRSAHASPMPRRDAGPAPQDVRTATTAGPLNLRRTETAPASLPATLNDPAFTTHQFDLRGAGIVPDRPTTQAALLHPDLPRQMALQLAAAAQSGKPDRPVQVLLNPAELGHVRMTLQGGEGTVNVTVIAERPETLDLMRRHIETLAQEFQRIGYRAAEFSFAGEHSRGSGNPAPDRGRARGPGGSLPDAAPPDLDPGRAVQVITDRLDLRL